MASLGVERPMFTGAEKEGKWVKRAGGACSGEEPQPCPREAVPWHLWAAVVAVQVPAVSRHTFVFFQSRDCLDICVHLHADHKIKTENRTKPQCFMGNRDTPERQTWLVGYLLVFPALSQQVSILVFGHYPKGSFSLPPNSSHLPFHFTKTLFQIIYSLI